MFNNLKNSLKSGDGTILRVVGLGLAVVGVVVNSIADKKDFDFKVGEEVSKRIGKKD